MAIHVIEDLEMIGIDWGNKRIAASDSANWRCIVDQ